MLRFLLLPSHRDRSTDHAKRPWWKSFRTTAAIGYCIRHYSGPWNRMVIERAGIRAGDRVVDIGCGPGEAALLAVRSASGVEVLAIDPAWPCCLATGVRSLGLLGSFRSFVEAESWGAVRVRRASAESLPSESGWATLVLSINAFHHWADPKRGLAEVRRVLAPGGRLVLVDEDFPEDHHHTRFHNESQTVAPVHAASPEVHGWLRELGFGLAGVERIEDAEGSPHHFLRAVVPSPAEPTG